MSDFQAVVPCGVYKEEGFGQSEKNESFADDSSNLTVLTYESMAELKSVLDNFRVLSGLSCNLEKSFVMRIGNVDGDIPEDIVNLGFTFSNKIELLGFTLNNYGNVNNANFEKIVTKINNIIRFWERFNLSLTGKLSVYKSLILPQLNYVAAIMTPDDQQVITIEKAMESFVTKGFSIAKERLYLPVNEGGLGMFKLLDFIWGLQCNWFKRCHNLVNDNWRATLTKLGGGDVLNVVNNNHAKQSVGPILGGIINTFSKFKAEYTKMGNNYMVCPIYCNEAFGVGRDLNVKLDDDFFGINDTTPVQTVSQIQTVTWSDLTMNNNIMTKVMVEANLGLEITPETYLKIKTAFNIATKKYRKEGEKAESIDIFFRSFKKG
jgi:hypothetical protein